MYTNELKDVGTTDRPATIQENAAAQPLPSLNRSLVRSVDAAPSTNLSIEQQLTDAAFVQDRRRRIKRQGHEVARRNRSIEPLPSGVTLTVREAQVLQWVAEGKSDWQIGQILQIAGKTVNFHAENAKKKLGVATRVQAALAAERAGLLDALRHGPKAPADKP